MKTPEISNWVDALDRVHAIVAATGTSLSTAEAERSLGEALATLERLHDQMLLAEIRVTVANTSPFGS